MPYGDKESYSFFKMKYQGNNSAFPFKEPVVDLETAHKQRQIDAANTDLQEPTARDGENPVKQRDHKQTLHSKPAYVKPGYTPL